MKFKYIECTNIRFFSEEHFKLEDRGLVSIIGKNGTGKTTLFSLLRVILFGKMKDGSSRDDLIRNNKDGSIKTEVEHNNHTYIFEVNRLKGKWTWTIIQDGIDITDHSQVNAPKQPQKLLGIDEEEWDSTVHLSQKGSHILLDGKPSAKKEYISEYFSLDNRYDTILEASQAELGKVNQQIKDIEAFSHTRTYLKDELLTIEILDLSKLQEENNGLEIKLAALSNNIKNQENLKAVWELYYKYEKLAYPEGFESVDPNYAYEFYIKAQAEMEQRTKNYNYAVSFNSKVDEQNLKLKPHFENIEQYAHLKVGYPEQVEHYISQKNEIEKIMSFQSRKTESKKILSELSEFSEDKKFNISEIENLLLKEKAEYAVMESKYKAINTGKCPLCGTDFEHNHVMDEYNGLVNKLSVIQKYENQLAEAQAYIKGHDRYLSELKNFNSYPELSGNDQLVYDSLLEVIPKLKSYEDSKNIIESTPVSDKLDLVEPATPSELEQNKVNIDFYKSIIDARRLCPEKPTEEYDELNLRNLIAERESLTEIVESNKFKIKSNAQNIERYKNIESQINNIDEKFKKLSELNKHKHFWEQMIKAYGPKGLRVLQLQKIADLIIEILPVYTSRLFPDKTLNVTASCDSGNLDFMVTRTDEEGTYTNSVSTLSGGEAKRMAVCLLLAIAKVRTKNKKINFVVLDEVDSQVDEDGQFLFANELIPMLKEDFESVFVVSHNKNVSQASVFDTVLNFTKPSQHTSITEVFSSYI